MRDKLKRTRRTPADVHPSCVSGSSHSSDRSPHNPIKCGHVKAEHGPIDSGNGSMFRGTLHDIACTLRCTVECWGYVASDLTRIRGLTRNQAARGFSRTVRKSLRTPRASSVIRMDVAPSCTVPARARMASIVSGMTIASFATAYV